MVELGVTDLAVFRLALGLELSQLVLLGRLLEGLGAAAPPSPPGPAAER